MRSCGVLVLVFIKVKKGSFFNSYYTVVQGRELLLSLDCSTLPLIRILYCWVLSKKVSSTIFKAFGMTRPGIKPRSPGPLANTLPTRPIQIIFNNSKKFFFFYFFFYFFYFFFYLFIFFFFKSLHSTLFLYSLSYS